MTKYFFAYAMTLVAFLSIDFIWLSQIARRFYVAQIGDLLLEKPNLLAAILFYTVFVVGIAFFAVIPALKAESLLIALTYGALFGFFTYATYDMTNYATLKNWPLTVVLVDIVWGVFITAMSAGFGYWATQSLMKAQS